ncbi:MAG: PHP domain-containing protein [bacterium]
MRTKVDYADLHVHTTFSDGVWTPEEVVRMGREAGLKAVGIADHDTMEGLERADAAGMEQEIVIVPGIEINTDYQQKSVHILGYYCNRESDVLHSQLNRLRQARQGRAAKIVEKLRAAGVSISYERVLRLAGAGTVGRPHVARAIIELGLATSIQDAFAKYLVPGRPGYVERYKITPAQATAVIRQSGGIPVLAHPGAAGMDELIPALLPHGLLGIEVYHPEHDAAATRHYARLAQEMGLLVTGGSDAHGPDYRSPTRVGSYRVPYDYVEAILDKKREIGNSPGLDVTVGLEWEE